jgi:hypothetical protein
MYQVASVPPQEIENYKKKKKKKKGGGGEEKKSVT